RRSTTPENRASSASVFRDERDTSSRTLPSGRVHSSILYRPSGLAATTRSIFDEHFRGLPPSEGGGSSASSTQLSEWTRAGALAVPKPTSTWGASSRKPAGHASAGGRGSGERYFNRISVPPSEQARRRRTTAAPRGAFAGAARS